jgi:hypothetical protein
MNLTLAQQTILPRDEYSDRETQQDTSIEEKSTQQIPLPLPLPLSLPPHCKRSLDHWVATQFRVATQGFYSLGPGLIFGRDGTAILTELHDQS